MRRPHSTHLPSSTAANNESERQRYNARKSSMSILAKLLRSVYFNSVTIASISILFDQTSYKKNPSLQAFILFSDYFTVSGISWNLTDFYDQMVSSATLTSEQINLNLRLKTGLVCFLKIQSTSRWCTELQDSL